MATDRGVSRGAARLRKRVRACRDRLTAPVDVASLAVFRIGFGLLMAVAAARTVCNGWVSELLIRPRFHFTYAWFPWVRVWSGPGMYLHFAGLAAAAIAVAVGFGYRLAIVIYFLGFTYVELIDKATYLNHYYLISLLAAMMMLLPLGRAFSWDARRDPRQRIDRVPAWMLYALRVQVGVVYIFAGLTKLNADWLLGAQPMRIWLHARSDLPIVGSLLEPPSVAYAASWLGALFDLSVVFLLLGRRTRRYGFAAVVVFHLLTALLFRIGIFPWLMILGTTVFLSPHWPREVWSCVSRLRGQWPAAPWLWLRPPLARQVPRPGAATAATNPLVAVVFVVHLALQAALPCRQYIDGEPSAWTHQGFDFAWNVMIAEKTGSVIFRIADRDGGQGSTERPGAYLTPTQAALMAQDPAMIRAFARHLAEISRRPGGAPVAVYADAFASLNGQPRRPLIDPSENLAR